MYDSILNKEWYQRTSNREMSEYINRKMSEKYHQPTEDVMTVSVYAVANKILHYSKELEEKREVTPLQLIKLVYISHGWHLALLKSPLFNDDIEAWPYGPVIPRIYRAVRHFRNSPILTELFSSAAESEKIPAKSASVIEQVVNGYGHLTGGQLSTITHEPDSPWSKTKQGDIIPDALIAQHFSAIQSKSRGK